MHSGDLTEHQCQQLMEQMRPMVLYLQRLKIRMIEQGFQPYDELLQLVDKAHDSMHHLFVDLHYRTCRGKSG